MKDLARQMVDDPDLVLPRLVDRAMRICGASSAGISLYEAEPAPGVFRWHHLRGAFEKFTGTTVPRHFSPCGVTLDFKTPMLVRRPERVYTWLQEANVTVPECLLVPLYVGEAEPLGTLWIVSEDEGHFTSTHSEAMTDLAAFAGIALKMILDQKRLTGALDQHQVLGRQAGHLAAIVQASFDAIVSMDLDGTIRSWNAAAESIFGWSAQELVGQSILTIIPADRRHEEDWILGQIRGGQGIPRFESIRLRKDGKQIPVELTVSPVRDERGDVVGVSKIARDASDALALRAKLEESEQQFRMLANNIPQLAWMADRDGWIYWYNDRWYEFTGTTLDQMRGWDWTSVHHPDHIERVKARIQQSWDTGIEWEDTFPLRDKNGRYRWFLSRAMPLRDQSGAILRWFGTNTDITEQRESEEKIQLLMGEANHRTKNMIAVIQALVTRTADKQYSETLAKRLQALSVNQDILVRRNWSGAPLGELIRSQLVAVSDLLGQRISLDGNLDIEVTPSAGESIGLAIHELCTNATKYGSLSVADGQVSISCSVVGDSDGKKLLIEWRESGGPSVSKPKRRGFGSVMIDRSPRIAFGAEVDFGFPSEGFFGS